MKTFKQLREDVSAGPVSVVGAGDIAGTGEKGGEPGVNLKRKKKVVLFPLAKRK